MNTYQNIVAKGSGKTASRILQEQYIKYSNIYDGDILTLPNKKWTMESMLLEGVSKDFRFVSVERDQATFNSMRSVAKKKNIKCSLHQCDLSEMIIGMSNGRYSHMLLDYCGTLQTAFPELKYALNNKLVKVGGTIMYTSNARIIGEPGKRLEKKFIKGFHNPKKKDDAYYHMVKCFIKREGGNSFVIDKVYSYSDAKVKNVDGTKVKTKGANMVLYVITRVK